MKGGLNEAVAVADDRDMLRKAEDAGLVMPAKYAMTSEVERVVMCKTEEKRSLPCTFCDCGNIDAQTLRMRKEVKARQTAIELATEGLDIDEHGYVI